MRRAEDGKVKNIDSRMGGDNDASATKRDAKDRGSDIELQKLISNGTEENSSLLVSDSESVESDRANEKSKKVKCCISTLKLLLTRGGLYAIAIAVLVVGGVMSNFYPSVESDLSEYENCSVTATF